MFTKTAPSCHVLARPWPSSRGWVWPDMQTRRRRRRKSSQNQKCGPLKKTSHRKQHLTAVPCKLRPRRRCETNIRLALVAVNTHSMQHIMEERAADICRPSQQQCLTTSPKGVSQCTCKLCCHLTSSTPLVLASSQHLSTSFCLAHTVLLHLFKVCPSQRRGKKCDTHTLVSTA